MLWSTDEFNHEVTWFNSLAVRQTRAISQRRRTPPVDLGNADRVRAAAAERANVNEKEGTEMIRRSILSMLSVALACAAAHAEEAKRPDNTPPEGFVALFNGKDLTNWQGLPKGPLDNPLKRAEAKPRKIAIKR